MRAEICAGMMLGLCAFAVAQADEHSAATLLARAQGLPEKLDVKPPYAVVRNCPDANCPEDIVFPRNGNSFHLLEFRRNTLNNFYYGSWYYDCRAEYIRLSYFEEYRDGVIVSTGHPSEQHDMSANSDPYLNTFKLLCRVK